MWKRAMPLVAVCVVVGWIGGVSATRAQEPLTAHEWGTFTTVAGPDGQAQEWLPLGGPSDLPCFVERYKNGLFKVVLAPGTTTTTYGAVLDYEAARSGLKGTVRMETPVLYFYATDPTDVSVSVGFPRGLFTEWYPKATVLQPLSFANVLSAATNAKATIAWPKVSIRPGTRPVLPVADSPSHYYAARATDAAPIQVNGQDEKFLFYRGVAGFGVSIAAMPVEGGRLLVRNLGTETIPGVVIFTNRGGQIGYRVHRTLDRQETFEVPPPTGTLPALHRELAAMLVEQGLYAKEADAMINTWRDTWFEEGTRVLYLVPKPAVEAILPLTITPTPAAITRVFVGRMDIITPDHIADVRQALANSDHTALARHGRLLSVIGERILATTPATEEKTRIEALLKATFRAYADVVTRCD